jgi:inner membrane transporter RhtA
MGRLFDHSRNREMIEETARFIPPEVLFLVGAIAQYSGAVVAKQMFGTVSAGTVAFYRVLFGGLVLGLVSRPWKRRWARTDLIPVALFGLSTALMNLCFYLAIVRLPLGKGVALEFTGPILVVAARTRSAQNWGALILAVGGMLVLSGTEFSSGDPLGLLFIFAASAFWAGYIVAGARVARDHTTTAGLSVGLLIGAIGIVPFAHDGLLVVATHTDLLLRCIAIGALSTAIGYGIDQGLLRRISTRRFALLQVMLPVTATAFGFLFLSQTISALDVVGIVLVCVAVGLQERDTPEDHSVVPSTDG